MYNSILLSPAVANPLRSKGENLATQVQQILAEKLDIPYAIYKGQIYFETNKHPLYTTWLNMRQRCNNPKLPNYKNYGGRGIKVCEEWEDFWTFVNDVGEKPTPHHTLDRRDNSKGYSKDNCRWATVLEQNNNRRENSKAKFIDTPKGAVTLSEFHREYIFNYSYSSVRILFNQGKTFDDIMELDKARNPHAEYA